MAKHISQAVASLEQRQRDMTADFAKAIEAMQANTADSQQNALAKTQEVVASLGESVTQLIGQLKTQVSDTAAREELRTRNLSEQAQATSDSLRSVIEQSHAQLASLTDSIRASVKRMEEVTTASVDKMNQGAETLFVASSDFAKASMNTRGLLEKADQLAQGLTAASSSVTTSSNLLAGAVSEYKQVRDEVQRLVSELRATIEAAKKEASLTGEALASIEAASEKLSTAQKQADEYLASVSNVLAQAHRSFADNITSTLRQANSDFHQHLTTSTKLLANAVDGLSDVVDRIPTGS
jgi:chromosome segregation ATPase